VARSRTSERLFNPLKRKILRKRISTPEVAFGAVFLALLVLLVVWVVAQKENFDPSERDISFVVLEKDSVEDTLYRTPFKRWVEPGSDTVGAAAIDLGIFPRGVLEGSWSLDGRVEVYDPSNVYEKINGAAEQYMSFGFRKLHYATLARDDLFLTIELYDQGEFQNVLGIFGAQRDTSRPVERLGDLFFYLTSTGAIGGIGNFYFKIFGSSAAAPIAAKARDTVELLTGLPVVLGPPPLPYRVLTVGLGLDLGQITFQKSNVFQYDFLTDFWFGTPGGGTEGRYFIHEGGNATSANLLFDQIAKEQENEYSVLERQTDHVLLQHEYLKTYFAMSRRGGLIFGVEGAASLEFSRSHLDRLAKALDRG
jgi:hypothetical protein